MEYETRIFNDKESKREGYKKILSILDGFKKKFNINYIIRDSDMQKNIGNGNTSVFNDDTGEPEYTYEQLNKPQDNPYNANGIEVAFHEYYHTLVYAIEKNNPKLWENLKKEVQNDQELIQRIINCNYNKDDFKELITTKLGILSRERLSIDSNIKIVKTCLKNLKGYTKLLKKDIPLENIPENLTISQLADFIILGKGKIDLSKYYDQQNYT